ncbi:MAG: hypothetical protein TYPL_1680 [Candidatus Tyloplasma litorale]|nr:MAG: hypothetical protein TYPL_1680 [Mycoplasmatales bacterium]
MELKRFQFIEVKEHETYLSYNGSELKNSRPYLVINPSISSKYFLCCPVTDIENSKKQNKKTESYWLKYNFRKPSYIKMNILVTLPKEMIHRENPSIKPINMFLNPSKRKIAIKLLIASIEDSQKIIKKDMI